jgi:hypothetical protein
MQSSQEACHAARRQIALYGQAETPGAPHRRRGVSKEEAERRAWATENKISGGGKKSGSGKDSKKS